MATRTTSAIVGGIVAAYTGGGLLGSVWAQGVACRTRTVARLFRTGQPYATLAASVLLELGASALRGDAGGTVNGMHNRSLWPAG
ncbi:hypothetical protein [Nocardia amikacinitolerans]|uniref:hypothetical protein n=1 Tax=Nocardia amikacinitolerans TaxID=756689 RepID=UPI0020A43239|nr:hypothetical protein [Nocardia amikacinitolerans]